ncbi:MAG: ribosomal protein S18-alanine N-acetyltransferase [Dehalococcoidia bacterium]
MRATATRCRIRLMDAGDIPQVLDIERQSFPTMWPQTVYQRELKNKMARYFVAYEPADQEGGGADPPEAASPHERVAARVRRFFGGLPLPETRRERILGLVGLWLVMGEGHIVTIAVRQDCRREGIGELLLVASLEAAIDARQDVVTLEYRFSNLAARALYEKYGFAQVGVRARYYSDNQEDAVLMTTPPLRSSGFRQLLGRRVADLRARWGDGFPLDGPPEWLRSAPSEVEAEG